MLKRILIAALTWPLLALAQSYPSPTFQNFTVNGTATIPHAAITGGTINGASIGATTPSTGAFTTVNTSGAATLNSLSTSNAAISGGSINGTPVGGTTASTGAFTNLSAANTFTVTNGTDVINASNNANNVLVITGSGTSTAKFISPLNNGGFIPSSTSNVSDGVAFRSDFINTAVLQGMNASGTPGYDTNLTLYRPSATNNAFLGVTMSPTPGAEQHLWMGTDYVNNRYTFTETITGTGSYLPITFLNGQALAFQIGTGTTPTTTFSGGGVVLNGSEGNQITWTLGGQTWSWNMASGGNFYIHEGTHNKFPLTLVPNSTASLQIGPSTSTFAGSITPSSTAGIIGTTTNDNANTGSWGEYVTAVGTSVALTSSTNANITSISLTAGDWDVSGNAVFSAGGGTTVNNMSASVGTTSATLNSDPDRAIWNGVTMTTGPTVSQLAPVQRISIASTTTVYLVANSTFSGGTLSVTGRIRARRVR